MKIVVTGGRGYEDFDMVARVLDSLDPDEVYVGDCPTGVDAITLQWCQVSKVKRQRFKARWTEFGRAAGPRRNREMLNAAVEDEVKILVAFPGGKGTKDCTYAATRLDMIVLRVG